ncbi:MULTISPECIES: phosphopantetheine-binding protein [Photorhabdus]|uniref:Phosphopantetheine-binding protein n=1 Tax=Photorhabdus bodei TaxID=2029681 RepID=A0AAW6BQD9_9GAMM|nr:MULTISPECIES: phosphopantetheine-binding protein [Photorhabdus]MCT8354381.1 phosphopantetheine-binding protein [Photorhabdus kayaii]MDB6374943.1 phosphopantetheine-binding protein [Photorhabdus bodei]
MITVEEVCAQISAIAHGVTVNPDGRLDESGIDSMTLVRLILQLEDEFDVILPDTLLGPETFETPRSITNALNLSKGE